MKKIFAIALIIIGSIWLVACHEPSYLIYRQDYIGYLDTDSYVIVEYDTDKYQKQEVATVLNKISELLLACEIEFSTEQTPYMLANSVSESQLMRLNTNRTLVLSPTFKKLLEQANECYEKTNGGFDFTIGALVELWNINGKMMEDPTLVTIPTPSAIANALEKTGIEYLDLVDDTLTITRDGLLITLGAIAKGFVGNEIMNYLQDYDFQYIAINLGGNIDIYGTCLTYPNANQVAIRNPFGGEAPIIIKTSGKHQAIVTSGIDMRYITYQEQDYHHLLDPATGYPFANNWESITVISDNGGLADGLATGLFKYSQTELLDVVNKLENIEVVAITADYEIIISSGVDYEINNITNFVIK